MNQARRDKLSKFLSWVLRHEPEEIKLSLDENGWVDVAVLIEKAQDAGYMITRYMIEEVVITNEKKRFAFSPDGEKIRAVQGHSVASVNIQYMARQPPEVLFHGTASRFLPSILVQGLLPKKRHYVHLSEEEKIAIDVGRRYGKPIVLYIASGKMYRENKKFFQADNGVWLTENVPPEFIEKVWCGKRSQAVHTRV